MTTRLVPTNDFHMNTKELIDRIFKEPGVKFELTEFENLGKPIHAMPNENKLSGLHLRFKV